jgi:hypothetical protein
LKLKNINLFLVIIFTFIGCTSTTNNQDLISVLEINKKLESLENRIEKTEKRVEDFSVILNSISKQDPDAFPKKEAMKSDDIYSSVSASSVAYTDDINPTNDFKKYLFINNLDKKTFEFDRTQFKLLRNAIVFNKKGEEVMLFRKETIIESSYRINKYFLIDSYIFEGNIFVPNSDIFVSEENFMD